MNKSEANSSDISGSFPPEILAHIFSYCYSKSIISPSNFTRVCSRWRSIAHSSPELWTNLVVELRPVFKSDAGDRVVECPPTLKSEADASLLETLIKDWILRSSDLSIDLTVNHPFHFRHPIQRELYTKIYKNIIVNFSYKWRNLLLPKTWEGHDFLNDLTDLPMLEELGFDVGDCSSSQILFPNAPRLYKLALTLPKSPSSACLDKLIPETIVDLSLSSAPKVMGTYHKFMLEFLQLGQLQHLTDLKLDRLGWDEARVLRLISLPTLLKLSIRGLISGLENLLNALTLPSLQSLSLGALRVIEGRTVGPALIGLQKRSHFPLSVLRLTFMLEEGEMNAIGLDDFLRFLSATDTINELHIIANGHTDTPRLMEILSYHPEKPILPHLKIFSAVSLSDAKDANCSCFVDFLSSRWWASDSEQKPFEVSKLEKFHLQDCDPSPKTQEYLEMCVEEGLNGTSLKIGWNHRIQ